MPKDCVQLNEKMKTSPWPPQLHEVPYGTLHWLCATEHFSARELAPPLPLAL